MLLLVGCVYDDTDLGDSSSGGVTVRGGIGTVGIIFFRGTAITLADLVTLGDDSDTLGDSVVTFGDGSVIFGDGSTNLGDGLGCCSLLVCSDGLVT